MPASCKGQVKASQLPAMLLTLSGAGPQQNEQPQEPEGGAGRQGAARAAAGIASGSGSTVRPSQAEPSGTIHASMCAASSCASSRDAVRTFLPLMAASCARIATGGDCFEGTATAAAWHQGLNQTGNGMPAAQPNSLPWPAFWDFRCGVRSVTDAVMARRSASLPLSAPADPHLRSSVIPCCPP